MCKTRSVYKRGQQHQKGVSHLDWGAKEEKERVRGTEELQKDSDIKAGF